MFTTLSGERAESPWWLDGARHTVLVMTTTSNETERLVAPRPDHSAREVVDGNEAAARIAHLASEVIAIYPITPASPMASLPMTGAPRVARTYGAQSPR